MGILSGAAAGAAGTTALNAATYVDMVLRGRPSSDTPQRSVEALAQRAHLSIPGDDGSRANRVSGLGALSGIATGVAVGALAGVLRRAGLRPGGVTGTVLIGLAAMAATDTSMARLKVTDPRTWTATDWLSDLVPHLVYGAVTTATLRLLDN